MQLCSLKRAVTFQPLDQGVDAGQIAVCANADHHMVGVGIAAIDSTSGNARLKSLLVQEPYRHRGIGQGLLTTLEQRVKAHGARCLEVSYAGGNPSAEVFTHILRKAGWQ